MRGMAGPPMIASDSRYRSAMAGPGCASADGVGPFLSLGRRCLALRLVWNYTDSVVEGFAWN